MALNMKLIGRTSMKVKIVTYKKGDNALDILNHEYKTNNPEIFTTGQNISLSSDEIYTIRQTWFDLASETMYVRVCKIGSKFNWLNGFL